MSQAITELNAVLGDRYRVERLLGEGGMASVYQAEDQRHGRKVALKVLKPELAAVVGAERFLAEIRTTASLQHAHILPVFDSGEAGGFLFYVMPHVEGESLRDRLERVRQLPVDEAVRIATQVAEALEHAHRQGVVHRDVKPANILLRGDDAFVSDFGIALAVGADRGRLTQTGVSMGTPLYMSPEQATGDTSVGAASDIWSLGCVLYEMLAGEPPYRGSTPQAILGRIVSGPPDALTTQRRTTPRNVEAVVARALETVPADRFESARDFASALKDQGFRHGTPAARRSVWAMAAAGAALYVLGLLTWSMLGRAGAGGEVPAPVSFVIPGLTGNSLGRTTAISPDGTQLARGSGGLLSLRRVGDLGPPRELTQTSGMQPFFSPNGEEVGYFEGIAQNVLRVSTAGGTPTVLFSGNGARGLGASWGEDGRIVLASGTGMYLVSSEGGSTPELLLEADPASGIVAYAWPQWLPGGRGVLLTVVPGIATDDTDCSISVLDLASGQLTEVLTGGAGARFVDGYLVYSSQGGTLYALEFDPSTYRTSGERVALPVEGLQLSRGWAADFDVSATGTLIYLPATQLPRTLAWVDRDGREEPLSAPPRGYNYPRVSPDGRRVAVDIGAQTARNISVWDIARETFVPITDDPGEEWAVEWNTRGDSLYYTSNRSGGVFQVHRRAADGSGEQELLFPHSGLQAPQDVSPDGRSILVIESRPSPSDQFDLMALLLGDPVRRDTVLSTSGFEYNASLSPDGRLVAYQTYESGQAEVYVRPMDGALRERAKVSLAGGEKPLWSPMGDTVFYRSPTDSMIAVPVQADPRLQVGVEKALFPMRFGTGFGGISGRAWDISPVDGRFLVVRSQPTEAPGLRVVLNWTGELRRLAQR